MHIAIGGRIEVEKGGEIIPKIVVGVDPCATKDFKEVTYPKYCPECGAPLVKDGSNYYCIGESCPAQLQARLEHFVSREAMNIQGIGPKMIEEWINDGIVKDVADIYESEKLETFFSTRIILSRTESKSVPAHRVLFALGIRYVGASTAKLLLKRYGSINMLAVIATACPDQLLQIDGVGVDTTISLGRWFSDKENLELLKRLQTAGLQMDEEIPVPTASSNGGESQPLAGLTIVISGVFEEHSRDEYRAMIEQYGGKNGSSVSKNTDYVLAGSNISFFI